MLALALLGSQPARADDVQTIPMRLKYVVDAGTRCPPEKLFHNRIAGLLDGLDPFTETAGPLLIVTLRRVRGAMGLPSACWTRRYGRGRTARGDR